jgi:prepilin-type N-terminal cleavage/methylation domain-containing protein
MRIWTKSYLDVFKQFCLFISTNKNTGFSMIEVTVTAIIVGILAAVAVPNLLGLMNQNRLKEAMSEVESGLKEAQRQAMRKGRSCVVTVDTTGESLTGAPAGCLLRERDISNISTDIDMTLAIAPTPSGTPPDPPLNPTFSYKGNITGTYTVILSHSQVAEQKCVVVSSGLGVIKSGTYDGTNCTPSSSD